MSEIIVFDPSFIFLLNIYIHFGQPYDVFMSIFYLLGILGSSIGSIFHVQDNFFNKKIRKFV